VALRTEIASRIYQHPLFRGYSVLEYPPIHVLVDGGRVVLAGRVATALERNTAEGIACAVDGILSVDNRLVVMKN
jgi:osmotically-inducible protein OsmY